MSLSLYKVDELYNQKLRTLYISQKLPKNIEERCVNFILLERIVN